MQLILRKLNHWWERQRVPDDGTGFWIITASVLLTLLWFSAIGLVLPQWQ
jgi:hypothetical protein